MSILLSAEQLDLTINRLAHQLIENDSDFENVVFIGLQPRGVFLSDAIMNIAKTLTPKELHYGLLDITFYRDDVRNELHVPKETSLNISLEGKKIVLIDDVLYTGRTIRAALDALQDFGRPRKVELCVLVNRRFNRELPIQPDYFGLSIDSPMGQKVKVDWDQKTVLIY
jgi:pyrimidine operon attenuation protein/uracil phosphoribosyltransferase